MTAMSEHSNMARTAAKDSLKSNFPSLLHFLNSSVVAEQLDKQGQSLNVREIVKLYGLVYGEDLDLSNVIIGGKKD